MNFSEAVQKAFKNLESGNGDSHIICNLDSSLMVGGPISVGWDHVNLYYFRNSSLYYSPTSSQVRSDKWALFYEVSKCPDCNNSIKLDNKFCSSCGKNLEETFKNNEEKIRRTL